MALLHGGFALLWVGFIDSHLAAAGPVPSQLELSELLGADDVVCAGGGENRALSLRQLRTGLHVANVSSHVQAPEHAAGEAPDSREAIAAEVSSEAAALERRANMTSLTVLPSSWLQTLTGKGGGSPMLYHQTSAEIAGAIMKGGFRPGNHGWCGGAIYFAVAPQDTFHKAIGRDSHKGVILGATVNLGRVCQMGRWCDRSMTPAKLQAKGCDSMRFNPGDGDEYVIYDPRRVQSISVVWSDHAATAMGSSDDMKPAAQLADSLQAELEAEMRELNAAMADAQRTAEVLTAAD